MIISTLIDGLNWRVLKLISAVIKTSKSVCCIHSVQLAIFHPGSHLAKPGGNESHALVAEALHASEIKVITMNKESIPPNAKLRRDLFILQSQCRLY
jgi:hypothetical protein